VANQEQVKILKKGVAKWNAWCNSPPGVAIWNAWRSSPRILPPNLVGADLRDANLRGTDLRDVDLRSANLSGANLSDANLVGANLRFANLSDANLSARFDHAVAGDGDVAESYEVDVVLRLRDELSGALAPISAAFTQIPGIANKIGESLKALISKNNQKPP
jgi:Pentapeptide repeats (8 copies)